MAAVVKSKAPAHERAAAAVVRGPVAALVANALDRRAVPVARFERIEGTSGPAARISALLAARASSVLGVVEPRGLDPEEARAMAAAAAAAGRIVVVLAPSREPRARHASPTSWPLPENVAWRGFLSGLGLVAAPDLAAWVEALRYLVDKPPPRGGRVSLVSRGDTVGLLPQDAPPALSVHVGARASPRSDVILAVPATDPEDEHLRLADRLRAIAALARRLPPGLPPASSREAQERAQFVLERCGRPPGAHDAMLLLASYGIHVPRQAVAHSASAATKIADRLGYPVDVRAAIGGLPAEEQGTPIVTAVTNAPGVRRAYATVNFDQERLTSRPWEAAVVRERAPHGPRVRAAVFRHSHLGWLATIAPPPICGEPKPALTSTALPLSYRAALRFASSRELAGLFPGGRFGAVAAAGLADVLMRLSRLVLDHGEQLQEVAIEQLVCTVQRRAVAYEARLVARS